MSEPQHPLEHWRRLQVIVDAALDVEPPERAALLDSACDDPVLRAEAEQFLRSCEDAGGFFEHAAADFAAPLLADAFHTDAASERPLVGLRVGPYRIVREAGRGGMGAVYEAERADGAYEKRVALKLVRHWLLDEEIALRRFREERQILASLEHPGIARLLDGGVTDAGLPWFAMEYVEGTAIDQYCDDNRLAIDARLRLFLTVCDAVQYAHRLGVVHRDLKPANILVTPEGEVKLLDFGIAKLVAVDNRATNDVNAEALTGVGERLMTPEYASPEQVRGDSVSSASDVYSLGVLLYKLLTGQHVYKISGLPPRAIGRLVLEETPEPPSEAVARDASVAEQVSEARGTTVDRLRGQLRGDVDRIVLTAIRREPERRYASAAALAADVRRHLDGLPVSARPDNAVYRARKFAQRYARGLAALGALIVVAALSVMIRSPQPPVVPGAATIAIVPFAPTVPDSALTRLGRDLVVTLSASLDNVGGIKTVDALTMLANVEPIDAAPSLAEAAALARRLAATSLLYGTLLRSGEDVRLELGLYPAGGGPALARATVSAPANDLVALTDSAAISLLQQVWQKGEAPTPSVAGLTTRSIPALREFLEGERLIVAGQWRAAAEAFERAIAADSTFWLAYWRYASARSYWAAPVDSAIVTTYRAHRAVFPERDRLLIEARMTDSLTVWYMRTRNAAERFPDYWPAWWSYSERLAHDSPLIGTTSNDLRTALERTVALNPGMVSAWTHLMWVAIEERDTSLSRRVLQELARLRYDTLTRVENVLEPFEFYRVLDHLARVGGELPDSLAEPGVRLFSAITGPFNPLDFPIGLLQYGFFRAQIDFARRLLRRGTASPGMAAGQHLSIALAQAGRGAWDSALVALDEYAGMAVDPAAPLYRYRMSAVGAWLGALPVDAAAARRAAVTRIATQLEPAARAEMIWLDGLLAVAGSDTRALAEARRALPNVDSVTAPFLERSLHAFALALAGDVSAAADTLVALERERVELGWSRDRGDLHPFLTAVNRLAAGRWLQRRDDPGAAARLLTWFEGVPFPLRATRHADAVMKGLGYFERARAAEALGQRSAALIYYKRFLEHYDAPGPAHRHLLDEARNAVAQLSRPRN